MARDSVGIPQAKDAVLATQRPIEWQIVEKADGYHVIKLARTPSLVLDVAPNMNPEKADLVLSLVVADKGLRQGWKFEWVEAEEPPLYARNIYIGPVPPGIYWLGQADENVGVAAAAKAPSVAGLTVAARLPLQEGEAASLHLSPVGNAPWPNQMWAVESGARGYRFRNLGTDTYLNYVNREPVAEPSSTGPSYSSEWCLKKPPSQAEGDLSAYIISPSADLNCLLAIMTNESFKKLGVKQPSFFQGPWSYMAWRFEPVDEMVLDLP
ncbi:hypothetical protein FRC03_011729 [Tulasnella sp. 419]|nr:hypothetical protein FRC03_011729 [Tulasnella sp. 419]